MKFFKQMEKYRENGYEIFIKLFDPRGFPAIGTFLYDRGCPLKVQSKFNLRLMRRFEG